MHRAALLKSLEEYKHSVEQPEDLEIAHQFIQFVQEHSDCFERSLSIGHLTASAWVVHPTQEAFLFTHHKKLNLWLQLGGHADGDSDLLKVALKEAYEESGLKTTPLFKEIFDLSIHEIPARKNEPAHFHYDVRYCLKALLEGPILVSEESHDVRWISLDDFENYPFDTSVLKMRDKFFALSQ